MTDESRRSPAGEEAGAASGAVRSQYDWSSTPPSVAVAETVAVAVDREPTAIEPLYESVDPDALDALVRSNEEPSAADTVAVSFDVAGRRVTVHGTGEVVVRTGGLNR